MNWQEKHTLASLGGGTAVVAALTLGPTLLPRPQVPIVTQTTLPPAATAQTAEPPTYPTTGSVTPLISGRLNLNTATLEQLESLPKVGPALAKRIVEGRPYHSLNDFDKVRGIGPATLKTLSPLVTW